MVLIIFSLLIFGFVIGQDLPKQGDVKLWHTVDESNYNYGSTGNSIGFGFVLVYFDGEWGTICDNGFSQESANVVCRQIGWKSAQTVIFIGKSLVYQKINFFSAKSIFSEKSFFSQK